MGLLKGLVNGKYSVRDNAGFSWRHLHCSPSNDDYGSGEVACEWALDGGETLWPMENGKKSSAEKTSP